MKTFYLYLTCIICIGFNLNKASATRVDSIDVLHYEISATIRNFSAKNIQSVTNITALVKYNGTGGITLDLLKLATTQVMGTSQALAFYTTDSTLHITLDKTYNAGDTLKLAVAYSGSPVLDGSWGGFYWSGSYAFNMGVGFTHSPHTFGRCLFPCIDNFTDKALYDFHITTDTGYMAVCSGLPQPATQNGNGSVTWHWYLAEPIPTYIAGIAVGKYAPIQYNFAGKQRSYPVILAAEAKDTANMRASFARLNNALQCFENLYGPYRFDRVGYVGVPFNSGAMEHAGNIAYPIYAIDGTTSNETLFAHELSHHWWGNLVTCASAEDMWLNEGWAAYCEAVFLECAYGRSSYVADIHEKLFTVLRYAHIDDRGYRAVSGVPTEYTYGTTVYKKGALMAHTLRTLMGDAAFFEACKAYLIKFEFKNASSADLRDEFQKHTGYDLTHFFNSWIFDKGHTDLQLSGSKKLDAGNTEIYIEQVSRWKTVLPNSMPMNIYFHNVNGDVFTQKLNLVSANANTFVSTVNTDLFEKAAYVTLNDDVSIMLGKTVDTAMIKKTGLVNLANALLSITVTSVVDSAFLYVEHHYAAPWQREELKPKNIRVSAERYWHIDGLMPATFKAGAYFNYDGSTPASGKGGFLDNELIKGIEDSIVLLYRPNASTAFTVHTDNTKQMAGNTDKTGRFTVNKIQTGDYVFGYYDKTAAIGSTQNTERLFKLYPNPADDMIYATLEFEHKGGLLEVFDISGKRVWDEKIAPDVQKLSVKTAGFKPGTYILSFTDEHGKASTRFMVK